MSTPSETRTPGRITGFVRRHPLVSLLLVFNTFGQAIAFVPVVVHARYGVQLNVDLLLIVPTILFLLLPALLITRIAHGPDGLRALARRMFRFDLPLRWYALPLIGFPVLAMLLAFALPPGGWHASTVLSAYLTGFVPALLFNFLTTNWWEETVWMGFFQAPLQQRFGPIRAVLITTPFFALEHLSLVFDGSILGGGMVTFVQLTVLIFFVRIFLGWVYNRTGSIALVGLIHAASNAVGFGLMPKLFDSNGNGGLDFLLLALLVLFVTRGRLGFRREPAAEHSASTELSPSTELSRPAQHSPSAST